MGIQQLDLLIRDEGTRDLSYDHGFCVCNTSDGDFKDKTVKIRQG